MIISHISLQTRPYTAIVAIGISAAITADLVDYTCNDAQLANKSIYSHRVTYSVSFFTHSLIWTRVENGLKINLFKWICSQRKPISNLLGNKSGRLGSFVLRATSDSQELCSQQLHFRNPLRPTICCYVLHACVDDTLYEAGIRGNSLYWCIIYVEASTYCMWDRCSVFHPSKISPSLSQ